jgi:hypothetical protein
MTLPTNDEAANCELSIEELEAIAAGWPHWLKTVAVDVLKVALGAGAIVAGYLTGGAVLTDDRGRSKLNDPF